MVFSVFGCGNAASEPNQNSGDGDPIIEPTSDPIPVDVVIISGQSNAVGCTKSIYIPDSSYGDKYEEYLTGYSDIKIAYDCWTKDWPASGGVAFFSQNASLRNGFVKTTLGQGNGSATFGPEIGIAESLHEKYANKLFLIKYACGASNLKDDWATRDSPMYGRLINYVKMQMKNLTDGGYVPTIRAFCWMQGEGDTYLGYYDVYQNNLREFVGNIREDLGSLSSEQGLPFIDAGISDAYVWEYYKQVNDAKVAFSNESPLNFFIDTIAAGMHTDQEPMFEPDIYHYDSESEILLGHLFADAIEPFLTK